MPGCDPELKDTDMLNFLCVSKLHICKTYGFRK